uniref:Uncharacterized protein n=1 Tax=Callorhinchus milii TaxID=7868 RepID=A0A4W3HA88_CALMI
LPLCRPCHSSDADGLWLGAVGELLGQRTSLESQTELRGETALHLACRFSQAGVAHRLLDLGADTNSRDHWGRTALHSAGSLETGRRLLSYGANRELPDHLGRTPGNVAAERAHHDLEQLLQEHSPEQLSGEMRREFLSHGVLPVTKHLSALASCSAFADQHTVSNLGVWMSHSVEGALLCL